MRIKAYFGAVIYYLKTMRNLTRTVSAFCLILILFSCRKYFPIPHPAPTGVFTLSPSHGPDSTLVTIGGITLGANDSVYFNGKLAQLISANDTQLVAMVPTLAGSGPVTVVANGKTLKPGTFTYDTTYRVTTLADSLEVPYYLTVDPMGTVYTSTYNNLSITSISQQGAVGTYSTVKGAMGIEYDTTSGDFYLVNWSGGGPFIQRLHQSGVVETITRDSFAMAIAVDRDGNVYTGNDAHSSVDKITPAGVITRIGSDFHHPSGIAVAGDGTIYVAHYTSNAYTNLDGRISRITPGGQISIIANINYNGQNGLVIGPDNNVYATVFDQVWANGWVSRITPDGTLTRLTSENLPFPCGIAMDKDGVIYVAEQVDAPGLTKGRVVKLVAH